MVGALEKCRSALELLTEVDEASSHERQASSQLNAHELVYLSVELSRELADCGDLEAARSLLPLQRRVTKEWWPEYEALQELESQLRSAD
jgi:hypothetical protein